MYITSTVTCLYLITSNCILVTVPLLVLVHPQLCCPTLHCILLTVALDEAYSLHLKYCNFIDKHTSVYMYFLSTGNYYLRLLLDEGGDTKFVNPHEFFNDLYHRFLLSPKPSMKAMCLQAMAIVYGQCYEEIGSFNDTEFVVRKLEQVCV